MKAARLPLALLLALPLCGATLPHTFVSSGGSDGDDCSRATPCRTFQGALTKTSDGGAIDAIDAADYGTLPLVIGKTVTINGAGVGTFTGAIAMNFGFTGTVTIRNLSINAPSGANAAVSNSYSVTLRLEHVVITGGPTMQYGVICGGSGNCLLNDVRIVNARQAGTGAAVLGAGAEKIFVTNCILQNSDIGVSAASGSVIEVDNSTIEFNGVGVSTNQNGIAGSAGTVRLGNNTITQNTTGLQPTGTGAVIVSFGNNRIYGNTTNGAFTLLTSAR